MGRVLEKLALACHDMDVQQWIEEHVRVHHHPPRTCLTACSRMAGSRARRSPS
jgi:hypothetical protein